MCAGSQALRKLHSQMRASRRSNRRRCDAMPKSDSHTGSVHQTETRPFAARAPRHCTPEAAIFRRQGPAGRGGLPSQWEGLG